MHIVFYASRYNTVFCLISTPCANQREALILKLGKGTNLIAKTLSFSFQNKNETYVFTINKLLVMKKYFNNISTIFQLLYCLHTSSIDISVQLLLEYSNYSKKRHIQRCRTYQTGDAYQSEALMSIQMRLLLDGDAYLRTEFDFSNFLKTEI